ncbi:MAG: hypothetical protein ACUVUG_03705 [Candidatus Aminicenantia bacterium]
MNKGYFIYALAGILIFLTLIYFTSSPESNHLIIKEPRNYVATDFVGDIGIFRNNKELQLKELPFTFTYKDSIKIPPFSGLTILLPDSSLLIAHSTSKIIIENGFISLLSGTLEWRKAKKAIKIQLQKDITLYTSESGIVETEPKTAISSLKGYAILKMAGKNEKIGELKRAIIDGEKLTIENLEKPPVITSPKNNEIYGDWKEDFKSISVNFSSSVEHDSYLFEVSMDPYFLNIIFSSMERANKFQLHLSRVGTGKRFARITPFSGKKSGIPSEPVVFFVRAFPLSKIYTENIPPKIDIYSVILSGNIAIVKGRVDRGCRLFVNKEEITPEPNGEFNVPVSFNDIGEKWIEIEAISPSGVSSLKRQRVFLVGY